MASGWLFHNSNAESLFLKLGDFEGFFHDVSGSVYALNQSSLLVKDFTYDGTGPDAFFWAGTDSEYPRSGN